MNDRRAKFDVYKLGLPDSTLVCSVEVEMIVGDMWETCGEPTVSCQSAECGKDYWFRMRTTAWGGDGCGGIDVDFAEVDEDGSTDLLVESQEASDYDAPDGGNSPGPWKAVPASLHFVDIACGGQVDKDFEITPDISQVTHAMGANPDTSMNIKFGCLECDSN